MVPTASTNTATSATTSDVTGTRMSCGKIGMPWPSVMPFAISGRNANKAVHPATIPTSAAPAVSVAASAAVCNRVAPASRSAAKRCSRRTPPMRAAIETNTATGPTMSAASIPNSTPRISNRSRRSPGCSMPRISVTP